MSNGRAQPAALVVLARLARRAQHAAPFTRPERRNGRHMVGGGRRCPTTPTRQADQVGALTLIGGAVRCRWHRPIVRRAPPYTPHAWPSTRPSTLMNDHAAASTHRG